MHKHTQKITIHVPSQFSMQINGKQTSMGQTDSDPKHSTLLLAQQRTNCPCSQAWELSPSAVVKGYPTSFAPWLIHRFELQGWGSVKVVAPPTVLVHNPHRDHFWFRLWLWLDSGISMTGLCLSLGGGISVRGPGFVAAGDDGVPRIGTRHSVIGRWGVTVIPAWMRRSGQVCVGP